MNTTTRYIGTCPACGRAIKVRNGKLVHHGYERPGYGYIEGDCFGVHYEPHETSPKCAEDYRVLVVSLRDDTKNQIETLLPNATKLLVTRGWPEKKLVELTLENDAYEFERERKHRIHQAEMKLRQLELEIERVDGLLKDWKPAPLTTVEEEKAAKQAKKAERERIAAEKREKKVADMVARYQKRLASASRRKTASVFIDIFETAPFKLMDAGKLPSRWEALSRLGVDHVWKQLGLLNEDGTPVYVEDRGRYKDYGIPYGQVRDDIKARIEAGEVAELKF